MYLSVFTVKLRKVFVKKTFDKVPACYYLNFLKTRSHRRHHHQYTLAFYLKHVHIIIVLTSNALSLFTTEMPTECQRLQHNCALLAPKLTRQSNMFVFINASRYLIPADMTRSSPSHRHSCILPCWHFSTSAFQYFAN